MCEANVYIKNKGEDKSTLLMEAVDKITPKDEELILESIFGEKKIVKAVIAQMALVDHEIILEHR